MAKPTQASIENKKKYAYAVLSGSMTRKDAYLRYINPSCATPVKSAAQLHKTKQMIPLLEEVSGELNTILLIKQASEDMTKRQLSLAQALLKDIDNKPYKEKLALLKSIKAVQESALATLKRLDDSYNSISHREGTSASCKTQRFRDVSKFIY